ncbi:MAG: phosphoglycolate phosphatase [Burkholderiales bacterium]|nr:phosphoglycolate phosphatase [Burkholderiales bacterium]
MIRAVLFDLDGTLADTAPDLTAALNALLGEHGRAPVPLERTRPLTSAGARGMLQAGFGIAPGSSEYEPLKARFLDLYGQSVCAQTRLFPGMDALLDALERRGLRWGVVTNKPERFTTPLLAALGVLHRAACVVSGDTTERPKPHPDPLLHAAGALALAPTACLYVGDDLRDVQAARAAGMPVVAAGYGYLGDGGECGSWQADGIIEHPLETLNFL